MLNKLIPFSLSASIHILSLIIWHHHIASQLYHVEFHIFWPWSCDTLTCIYIFSRLRWKNFSCRCITHDKFSRHSCLREVTSPPGCCHSKRSSYLICGRKFLVKISMLLSFFRRPCSFYFSFPFSFCCLSEL